MNDETKKAYEQYVEESISSGIDDLSNDIKLKISLKEKTISLPIVIIKGSRKHLKELENFINLYVESGKFEGKLKDVSGENIKSFMLLNYYSKKHKGLIIELIFTPLYDQIEKEHLVEIGYY